MKPDFKKAKSKKIITLILGPIFLAGVVFFIINFLYERVYQAKDDLARENLILDNLIEEGSKVDKYKELEEKMQFNSQIVDEAVVKEGNEIELIKKLEEVAGEANIKIEINEHDPPKKVPATVSKKTDELDSTEQASPLVPAEPEIKVNYFMISMKGTYPQFLNFLHKLENLGLIVKIESIKTTALSVFEFERLQKAGEIFDIKPTLKSDILISYNPQ